MQRLVQRDNPSRTYGPKSDGLVFHNLGRISILDGLLKVFNIILEIAFGACNIATIKWEQQQPSINFEGSNYEIIAHHCVAQ